MVHDAGPAAGRLARMRQRFPDVDAVIFGHSHMPLHETAGGRRRFQIFNPGQPDRATALAAPHHGHGACGGRDASSSR